jgi:hypothetical protein
MQRNARKFTALYLCSSIIASIRRISIPRILYSFHCGETNRERYSSLLKCIRGVDDRQGLIQLFSSGLRRIIVTI